MTEPKHAVITGASRGLGRGVASALAEDGWHVWVCSEVPEELEATEAAIRQSGGMVTSVCTDLADPAGCELLVASVRERTGQLRAIVNNAALLQVRSIEELSLSDWTLSLSVNLTAPFIITRGLLPLLADGGSIINVSSRAGVLPFKNEAAYCASKFGIEAFSRCLALELEGRPISVNTITPGTKIKPTSIAERDIVNVPEEERKTWLDPVRIGPAFVLLARLRGQVSGCRFNATTLTDAIERWGPAETLQRIDALRE